MKFIQYLDNLVALKADVVKQSSDMAIADLYHYFQLPQEKRSHLE